VEFFREAGAELGKINHAVKMIHSFERLSWGGGKTFPFRGDRVVFGLRGMEDENQASKKPGRGSHIEKKY